MWFSVFGFLVKIKLNEIPRVATGAAVPTALCDSNFAPREKLLI
jgi:hypothetical protein